MPDRKYPVEGRVPGYRCPKCGSTVIVCTAAAYEFSTLECQACGYSDTMDDLQISEWIIQ